MGKKKGRQSDGFGSKARRAAFNIEWQSMASEVPLSRGKMDNKQAVQVAKERPKLRLNHLHHILQERLHHDRIEDAAQRQRKPKVDSKKSPPSPCFIYDNDDDDDDAYRETGLALLCVMALAPVLQDYISSIGKERTHYYLSLLPAKTLTALSVELSLRRLWKSEDMVYVVCHHAHITRLAIWLPPPHHSKIPTIDKMLLLQPEQRLVPECWEDYDDACLVDNGFIRRLARLELRNVPALKSETVLSLQSSVTSHLSLSGSMDWIEGPNFLENLSSATNLKVLDLSECLWMTRRLLLIFRHKHPNVRLIHELDESSSHFK
jgi:hypothetical protein